MGGGRWKAGCGIRWFGGMGERWKINGRRRGGCGPGMPGPYRVVEGCAGVGWFRAIFVGGGVLDVPRRGQDPSLRCGVRRGGKAVTGGGGKRAGRACPAPTGVMVVGAVCFPHSAHVNVENTCIFYLIIIV